MLTLHILLRTESERVLSGRRGQTAENEPDRGGRREESEHGASVHRRFARCQRRCCHSLKNHQESSVSV